MEKLPNASLKDKFTVDRLIYRSEKGYVTKGLGRYWDSSSALLDQMGDNKMTFKDWQIDVGLRKADDDDD